MQRTNLRAAPKWKEKNAMAAKKAMMNPCADEAKAAVPDAEKKAKKAKKMMLRLLEKIFQNLSKKSFRSTVSLKSPKAARNFLSAPWLSWAIQKGMSALV